MTPSKSAPGKPTDEELQLLQRLREHPELKERLQSVLEIAASPAGLGKSADEVEELLIQELRRLGNTALGSWAARVEQHQAQQLEQADASARMRKKKR